MTSFSPYVKRPIRFLEIHTEGDWKLKVYSISSKNEKVSESLVRNAKKQLSGWLQLSETNPFDIYNIGTLILHEWSGGCFAIVNWWTDQNMLQHYVYLSKTGQPGTFELFSGNGIVTCIWESAVIWFERNAWLKHVLMKNDNPDFESYLNEQLNQDV